MGLDIHNIETGAYLFSIENLFWLELFVHTIQFCTHRFETANQITGFSGKPDREKINSRKTIPTIQHAK